eukprot:6177441-Pleurochrysis_carterae.AAC.2
MMRYTGLGIRPGPAVLTRERRSITVMDAVNVRAMAEPDGRQSRMNSSSEVSCLSLASLGNTLLVMLLHQRVGCARTNWEAGTSGIFAVKHS